jgi:hypothetical protein
MPAKRAFSERATAGSETRNDVRVSLRKRMAQTCKQLRRRGTAGRDGGSGHGFFRSYTAYCAMPSPKDQFSFRTSTRLMKTSCERTPGALASPSTMAL